jgi:hypothetical protein
MVMTKMKPFLCVICNVNPRGVTSRPKEFKICSKCFMKITKGYETYQSSGIVHTKCQICGKDINHSNTHPICPYGGCRGLWYRRLNDIKRLKSAIETHDYSLVKGFNIEKIRELGYDVIINEGVTVQQESNQS